MGSERGSSFFLGFLALPRAKRGALSAVYAYCRLIDDVVDSGELPKEEARRRLAFWRDEVGRLYEGKASDPAAKALERPVADYSIPKEALLEMIRGCALDLEGTRYETIEELEGYMRGVACSVGEMCVRIFGWERTPEARMRDYARDFGYAFQLTNILRDVGADLHLGRVYLPLADLRAAGVDLDALGRREESEALRGVLELQYRRAKAYYARAREALDPRDRRAMRPAELMAHVYEGLLDDVRGQGWPVLRRRVRLSGPRKLELALRAWRYCDGG